ncbi:MAG TPA: M61 family peptidase [Bacteroidetes bacterium]|nr:M61 family peptidase [Bacteroidota bacterium]
MRRGARFWMAFWIVLALMALASSLSGAGSTPVVLRVAVADTVGHYFDVQIEAGAEGQDSLYFKMPVWIPGSYLIREFEGQVFGFSASDGAKHQLPWKKTDKNTWRVYLDSSTTAVVRYRVYAFNPDIHYSYVDADRAFLNPSSVCMFVAGRVNRPYRLELSFPQNWTSVSTTLQEVSSQPLVFIARNYDELVDSPIEIGHHRRIPFQVEGIPFELAFVGSGNVQPDTLIPYLKKIVQAGFDLMGSAPFDRYVFFLQLRSSGGGGLEHRNSCVLQSSRWSFRPYRRFQGFLGLVAHEFFHAWNVKAFRPFPLGPFDYSRENYTVLLWVAEGLTSYYAPRLLLRAGLLDEKEYLKRLQQSIEQLERTPGRKWQSLAESSFDAWIKFYRPNENSPNVTVSYYSKGALIGAMLDLLILHETGGKHSLDDVMRLLYERYHLQQDRAYTLAEFKKTCEEVAGRSLDGFFKRYVLGTEELDFARYLSYVGLELRSRAGRPGGKRRDYGFRWRSEGDRIIVTQVINDSPAYRMGISAGDELIALDTYRLSPSNLTDVLELLEAGEWHYLTISRDGMVRRLRFEWTPWTLPSFEIVKADHRTREQRRLYSIWLYLRR